MDLAKLRAEFRRRTGRELRVPDERLAELIAAARSRHRVAPVPVEPEDGYPSFRWSNERLDYPHGINDPATAPDEPSPGLTLAPPVGEQPWMAEVREALARHPAKGSPEFDRPDLHVVPSEEGEPTYARHEETG